MKEKTIEENMGSGVIEAQERMSFKKEVITTLQNAAERLRKMKTENCPQNLAKAMQVEILARAVSVKWQG